MRTLSPISSGFAWPSRNMSSDLMGDMFEDFDRVVDRVLRPAFASTIGFQPSDEVSETKDGYLVSFDMPGLKKQDIKIAVHGNELVISGERHRGLHDDGHAETARFERRYGKFERAIALPASVNTERIEAQYEDGVLTVALPKAEAAKARNIEVQSGRGGIFSRLLGSKKEGGKDAKELKDVSVS